MGTFSIMLNLSSAALQNSIYPLTPGRRGTRKDQEKHVITVTPEKSDATKNNLHVHSASSLAAYVFMDRQTDEQRSTEG